MADDALTGNPVRELAKRFAITLLLGLVVYRLGRYRACSVPFRLTP